MNASMRDGGRAGGEDVEVAARFAAAAKAAHRRDVGVRARSSRSSATSAADDVVGLGHEAPAGEALALLERLEDERLLLGAHALQRADAALARRALEIVERPDLQAAVEERDRLRADPLQAQQVQDGRRKLLQQILMIAAGAGVDELARSSPPDPFRCRRSRAVPPG